jgi:PAS domain S-box-containing protein
MNKQLRILILEDDITDAELMEHELRKANFTFTSKRVETGEAFQENLVDFAPELILADYTLPSFDGCSALRIAKEKCPDVPFIFVSGTIGEDFAIESLKSGATDYILKDRLSRLAPAVHRALSEVKEKIEYRKAEKALKESELRFRSVVQSANDAIILMDGKCIIFSWNTGAQAMFGYMEKEVIGKSISHIIPERYKKDHMKKIACASLAAKPGINGKRIESYGLRKGGIEFPVDISMATWKTDEGTFYSAIIRDITEREQAEKEKDRLLKAIDNSNDGIIISDEKDRYVYLNEAYAKIYGYPEEELIGETWRKLTTPELIPPTELELDRTVHNKNIGMFSGEVPGVRKDGTIIPIEVRGTGLWDENGSYEGHICIVRDITERKRAEEELLKFKLGIERLDEVVFITNIDGTIIYANPAFEKIYGYNREETLGKTPRIIKSGLLLSEAYKPFWDTLLAKKVVNGELVNKTKDGRLLNIGGSANPILDNNGNIIGFLAIQRDITERKRAEEKIEASLKEKETLLREIHHRVKNNMQIVSSLLGLQAESIKEKKYLEMFRDSRNRIMSMYIIHEKLYRSRDLEKIEFNEYIRDLANGLLQSHGVEAGKVGLNINVGDTSLGIDFAIPCGLIINELITNSLKYAFPDGRDGKISIILHPLGKKMFELVVSDNGIGIPGGVDFRKTESLGLRLVTILAENQLHGQIDLNRTGGTEFKIKFKGVK